MDSGFLTDNRFSFLCVYICVLIYMYTCVYFLVLSAEAPRSSDTPVTRSSPSSQLLVYRCLFSPKGTRAPWRHGSA